MYPSYLPGDFVLVWGTRWQNLGMEDVVVVNHPLFGKIIKRISRVLPGGKIQLKGDNFFASTTENDLGECEPDHLIGKVVWRLSPGKL